VDTLHATLSGGGAPFSAGGSAALAAGAGSGNALQVGLDTSQAGIFAGSADLAFSSRNPDLPDLGLAGATVSLAAQVNRLAAPALAQTAGAGSSPAAAAPTRWTSGRSPPAPAR
jgi:hypothetical protein